MPLPNGTQVRAKRAGWDEELSQEQALDLDPYEYEGDDDLEGELFIQEIPAQKDCPAILVCRVDGQPADLKTVVEAKNGLSQSQQDRPAPRARSGKRRVSKRRRGKKGTRGPTPTY